MGYIFLNYRFNVSVAILLTGGTGPCPTIGCTDVLMRKCSTKPKMANGSWCYDACTAFNKPEYCCTRNFSARCPLNAYSKIFKVACPTAISYLFDDSTSTFACPHGLFFNLYVQYDDATSTFTCPHGLFFIEQECIQILLGMCSYISIRSSPWMQQPINPTRFYAVVWQ